MNNKAPIVLFFIIIALAALGGVWQSSVFAATVPPVVPSKEAVVESTPVVDVWQEGVVSGSAGASVNLPGLAEIEVPPGTLAEGSKVKVGAVNAEDIPLPESFKDIRNVLYIGIEENDVEFSGELKNPLTITLTLTPDQVEAFKKAPALSIQRYDAEQGKWVRIPSTLSGNKLVIQTKKAGYFVFGSGK
ncbi:MAG: hypothetical protein LWX83_11490 [Anaerolineae bacterium]|nr:hypothetical protein [Anaerolineae bacterium]